MIEVEARSFISKEKYDELVEFMKENADFLGDDNQITYYFSGEKDLRIQKSKNFSKIWLKKGKIHDNHREEIEIKFDRDDFVKIENIFKILGYEIDIKWFRDRKRFDWNGIKVTIDHTKGYGFIIELEKLTENEDEKEKIYAELEEKLRELGVKITPKEIFKEKYDNYKNNWRKIVA